jgi:hypothetical protein
MSKPSVRRSLVVIGVIGVVTALIIASAGAASAATAKQCTDAYNRCVAGCSGKPGQGTDGSPYEACIGKCGLKLVDCTPWSLPPSSTTLQTPTGTTQPPPKGVSGLPPVNVGGVNQPGGGSPPPKGITGLPPIDVGVNKQPVDGGGASPPKPPIGLLPPKPVVGVNQPGTGSGPGTTPIYEKSGAAQQNKLKVQGLIKSWQQKVNDKNSVFYTGETQRGAGSVSPKVKSQIFNQTKQNSMHMGSGKQKFQTETLHLDKEKSNVQNWGSASGSPSLSTPSQHHGGHR